MSNTDRHPECHMRTALGNCDPIGGFCTSVNEPICEAFHRLYKQPGGWIPCSERLPEKSKQVMCCDKQGRVFTSAMTYINSNGEPSFGKHYGVIAWQPLPEPWEGANDETD